MRQDRVVKSLLHHKMKSIKEKIEEGYLFGCIKYKRSWNVYLMPVAYWILNYTKYDPQYNPNDWEEVFREHIYIVTDQLIEKYIEVIQKDSIGSEELRNVNFNKKEAFFEVYIDFDCKVFTNSFDYIELQDYLPDSNWIGKYENPVSYLPEQLKTELGLI